MLRCVLHRLFRDGRLLVVCKRKIHSKTLENTTRKKKRTPDQGNGNLSLIEYNKRGVIVRLGTQARRLLVDNVPQKGNHQFSNAEASSDNIRRLFYGNRFPIFAFASVGLVTGTTGIISKDEELESLCWEIRDTVVKVQQNRTPVESLFDNVRLEDLEIGPSIGKGCSAVVFAAALKAANEQSSEKMSADQYPLALKMMFNYDIQSNALMILRAMYRETIPTRHCSLDVVNRVAGGEKFQLPAHANVVAMFNAFCAEVPRIEDAENLYPMALPPRLYAEGYGRNMSLFLLMKRYDTNLEKFLKRNRESKTSPRVALILFAQLLEAVAHLHRYGIAHRDLKSDNILIERRDDKTAMPNLVLTDFGCSLMDKRNGFQVPYPTEDVDKGGNAALMAPEIITARPGPFAVLDYSKSDLWAAGTIAYEIFGMTNPFLNTKHNTSLLKNVDYNDNDLPELGRDVPWVVRRLINNMLMRNPKKRLNPDVAANVMQLFLWAPTAWLRPAANIPSSDEIVDWLYCLTTKVLCENIFSEEAKSRDSYTEYLLISSFLQRASLNRIKQALLWIQTKTRPLESFNALQQ